MGKYPSSPVHNFFSDWHYKNCKKNAYLADIDRIWVELRNFKIIAIFDLKTDYEVNNFKEPVTEKILRDFFEKQQIPYFIVVVNMDRRDIPNFIIKRNGMTKELSHWDMIDFIDNLENEIKKWM